MGKVEERQFNKQTACLNGSTRSPVVTGKLHRHKNPMHITPFCALARPCLGVKAPVTDSFSLLLASSVPILVDYKGGGIPSWYQCYHLPVLASSDWWDPVERQWGTGSNCECWFLSMRVKGRGFEHDKKADRGDRGDRGLIWGVRRGDGGGRDWGNFLTVTSLWRGTVWRRQESVLVVTRGRQVNGRW